MVRKKKADNVQQELSLFSPEDFLEKVETALQEAPSPIEQVSEEEEVFDRERLLREMKLADDFLNGREMNEIRLIAMQMTMQYQNGISRNGRYGVQVVPGKELDWYQFVALYYSAFALSFPSMTEKLEPELMACYEESR